MRNVQSSWLIRAAVAALLPAVPPPVAMAQSPSMTVEGLEEILVTARKRDEALLDVPVAVNAFGADEIASAGITRPQDFIALTPNMTMIQTQNQGTSFIVVRGISQARNSEPSVAVLIDGVLMANPSQFNQELYDIERIQVLKGPQGALYGRNAIGGAVIIETREPGDEIEGSIMAGYDSGPGYKVRAGIGGPLGGSDTWKFQLSGSYFDTDGYIDNPFLGEEADPFEDLSGRAKLIWEPNDSVTADLRVYISQVDTQALYFNIVEDVNDTSLPVRVNNRGNNERDMAGASLKLDFDLGGGVLTSITAYDELEEILTGDQFDFLPIPESALFNCPFFFCGVDQAQHQWLDVDALSQEIRYTSPADQRFRWILGAYVIATDRFISTGNVFDFGTGVVPEVKTEPLPQFAPQVSYLADSQDNLAWAAFGELSYDLTDQVELSVALRYDRDERENTTETPLEFIPDPLAGLAFPGQVREDTWDEWQPKVTLRYETSDTSMIYASYSRGFRSGGFNQTGVGTAGIAGVGDQFDEETADTYEIGGKAEFMDRRLSADLSLFYTEAEGTYFFVFDPNTSTQNLGNLDEVEYKGFELQVNAVITEGLDGYLNVGYTDSEIKKSDRDITGGDVGKQAPLVSEYTANVGLQYSRDLGALGGMTGFIRADYELIGPTWFYPDNFTERDPVNLFNLRGGLEGESWAITAWSKNLFDEEYNSEWSPGPMFFPNPGYVNNFVFKAPPQRWGVDVTYRF
jgi:iron complex outermembrane receptor protein